MSELKTFVERATTADWIYAGYDSVDIKWADVEQRLLAQFDSWKENPLFFPRRVLSIQRGRYWPDAMRANAWMEVLWEAER